MSTISESLSDVVVPATLQLQTDPVFSYRLFSETTLKASPVYTHKDGAELGKYNLEVTKHEEGYDVISSSKQQLLNQGYLLQV